MELLLYIVGPAAALSTIVGVMVARRNRRMADLTFYDPSRKYGARPVNDIVQELKSKYRP